MGDIAGADGSLTAPLAPYRVIDLTTELGWLCGKILAELGADVVKVEPPGGDDGREGSAWCAYNVGKRGVTLDLEDVCDRELLLRLAVRADFLIESFRPGTMESLGLGWERLHAANPRLVMTSITPYGQDGPLAAAPASDLELMAAGGAVWLAGDPDRPPVRISLPQAACWASAYATVGTLIAHHHRMTTGRGQRVDASAQAGVLPAIVHAPMFWDVLGTIPQRAGPFLVARNVNGAEIRNVWPCRDGYVAFALYGGAVGRRSVRALVAWMEERGMAPDLVREIDWDRFEAPAADAALIDRLQAAVGTFLLTLTKREFYEGAIERRILGYTVATAPDVLADEQLVARDAWQVLDGVRHPSGYARFDGIPARPRGGPPGLGEHNDEVLAEVRGD
jgi:crotonobetainyl-CoA:carnitine CoA-transferase CaiB-like acyl-CoA transferase